MFSRNLVLSLAVILATTVVSQAWIPEALTVYSVVSTTLGYKDRIESSSVDHNRDLSVFTEVGCHNGQNLCIEAHTDRCYRGNFKGFRNRHCTLEEDSHSMTMNIGHGNKLMNLNVFPYSPNNEGEVQAAVDTNIHNIVFTLGQTLQRRGVNKIVLTPQIMKECGVQTYGKGLQERFVMASDRRPYYAIHGIEIRYNDLVEDNVLANYANSDLKSLSNAKGFARQLCNHLSFSFNPIEPFRTSRYVGGVYATGRGNKK